VHSIRAPASGRSPQTLAKENNASVTIIAMIEEPIAKSILIGAIGSILAQVIIWIVQSNRRRVMTAAVVATRKAHSFLTICWRRVLRFFVVGGCIFFVAEIVQDTDPITKLDVVMICFWMFFAGFSFVTGMYGWHTDEQNG